MQKKPTNNWLKFSQIGIQMAVTITICAYLGVWLDQKYIQIAPLGVAGLSLFGVFIALYNVFKQVKNMQQD